MEKGHIIYFGIVAGLILKMLEWIINPNTFPLNFISDIGYSIYLLAVIAAFAFSVGFVILFTTGFAFILSKINTWLIILSPYFAYFVKEIYNNIFVFGTAEYILLPIFWFDQSLGLVIGLVAGIIAYLTFKKWIE